MSEELNLAEIEFWLNEPTETKYVKTVYRVVAESHIAALLSEVKQLRAALVRRGAQEELIALAESLRRYHLNCEDCWYSCPKSGGCCNDAKSDRCDCGADEHNARLDQLTAALRGVGTRKDV